MHSSTHQHSAPSSWRLFFDLDGTLSDPKEGMTRSFQHALKSVGRLSPPPSELTQFIGPPLRWTISRLFSTDEPELIEQGVLGRLVRATWIITDWFRSQTYYDNGGWRATWKGEGGGVLLNQCPHNLDIYQWYFGVPKRVAGYASIGKYHRIEVEDEVTGYFEHENGMVGHFITTTAESPGSNRLEIVGENGCLIFEDGRLTFAHNRASMLDFIRTSPSAFDRMEYQLEDIPFQPAAEVGHAYVIEAFANAILHGGPLVARAEEGIHSLALGNAIMLSQFLGKPVDLPFDADLYEAKLLELVRTSQFQKETREGRADDFNKSFEPYH